MFSLQLVKCENFALCENLFILNIDFSLFDLRFFKFFFFVKMKENSTIEQLKCKCHKKTRLKFQNTLRFLSFHWNTKLRLDPVFYYWDKLTKKVQLINSIWNSNSFNEVNIFNIIDA